MSEQPNEAVLGLLEEVGAVIADSHLVYKSRRHGSAYVNKDALYPHTIPTSMVCAQLADNFAGRGIEVVVGPALGGIVLSQWTAHNLSRLEDRDVLAVYAEKGEDGAFVLRRGHDKLVAGKRVLVVEDVTTTGGSVKEVVELVKASGGIVVSVGLLCNRGGVTAEDIGVPELFALVDVNLESYPEDECPLCERGVPINTDVGHGAEFLARQEEEA